MNSFYAARLCDAVERAEQAMSGADRDVLWALAQSAFALGALEGIDRALRAAPVVQGRTTHVKGE